MLLSSLYVCYVKAAKLKGRSWEELRPTLPLVLYGSVGATHQSGILSDRLLCQEQAGQFHQFHDTLLLFSCLRNHEPSLKERACRKTTGQQPLLSIVLSLKQYCAMNLGNMLTWSSFPTSSHQIMHRDLFWTVAAQVE